MDTNENGFDFENEFEDDEPLSSEMRDIIRKHLGLPTPDELNASRARSDAIMYNMPVIKAAQDMKKWLETEYKNDLGEQLDVKMKYDSYFNCIFIEFVSETFGTTSISNDRFSHLLQSSNGFSVCVAYDESKIRIGFKFDNAIKYLNKKSES